MPNGQKQQHKPNNYSSPPEPENNADVSGSHEDRSNTKYEASQKQGIWNGIKKTTSTDRITAFATVIIMIATTAYSIIALKQWKVMERQTDAAFQQLSTAKGNIKIANDALEDARKSGEEQSAKTERLTRANEKIAQASKQSVDTARQVAKKTMDATIENFHLEQRAWVGPIQLNTVEYKDGTKKTCIKEGEQLVAEIKNVNSGKTPAFNLKTFVVAKTTKKGVNS